jgi:hypothetical protein
MRNLTLDEKISFKGIFAKKGLVLPKLGMKQALFFYGICYGNSIAHWYKANFRNQYGDLYI